MILFGVWIFSETRYPESRGIEPRLSITVLLSWVRWLATVGRAAAFAFAGVFALAAVVSALATALAFARVLPFAGVLVGFRLLHFERNAGLRTGLNGVRRNGERTAHQAGDCGGGNHCFSCHVTFLFLCWFFWPNFRTTQYVREPRKKVTSLYTPHPASI